MSIPTCWGVRLLTWCSVAECEGRQGCTGRPQYAVHLLHGSELHARGWTGPVYRVRYFCEACTRPCVDEMLRLGRDLLDEQTEEERA